jgi:hypothetical protein
VGAVKELSAHFTASVLRGSTLSHSRHWKSVLPFESKTGLIRLLQCGHLSMTDLPVLPRQWATGTKVPNGS